VLEETLTMPMLMAFMEKWEHVPPAMVTSAFVAAAHGMKFKPRPKKLPTKPFAKPGATNVSTSAARAEELRSLASLFNGGVITANSRMN